jgi:hypothetical protein
MLMISNRAHCLKNAQQVPGDGNRQETVEFRGSRRWMFAVENSAVQQDVAEGAITL